MMNDGGETSMKITMNTNEVSVCDGCSNWRICKFSEDVKRSEAEYKQLRENADWPECVETTLGCKYKQFVTNRLTDNLINKYSDTSLTGFPVTRFDSSSTCNTVE